MIINKRELKQALNRVYLKIKPDTETIQVFQANLTRLLEQCDSKKSEEFNKNLLIDFLKNTYYTDRYFINTKERIDLVIHNNQDVKSPVGVIFETKKPTRTINAEMPRLDHLNTKAFQQLVLYFLRERVTDKNLEIKHLIVTNIYEWFIFDGKIFEELFFANKALVNQFCDFEAGRLSSTKTDFFYQQIAEPAITKVIEQIKFTHFDLRDLENLDLLDIYKILSPEHLLKLPFVNDSNTLNKPFYNELLYIIGLTEVKEKGKKLIKPMKAGDRCDGSLIENAISRLDSLDKIAQLKNPEEFGTTDEERLYNVALRLSINWINRVLFLKLLEAQLIKYHQGDRDFAFLNLAKVPSYDDLDSLFFDVLARETNKREAKVKTTFAHVPYLNSSLFEPTETEQQTIFIGNLRERTLPIFTATVLKDNQGNKRVGELNALAYLFEFLDAYKFDRDELENPQEDSEKLINASVLGLIFEKINGYKDGSFYTPSFITMYMCRETIRRAIVQKFNEVKGWNCQTLDDLYERIEDKREANTIINSLKICDPAVGSGHFLVSALNEIIAIKSELRVLLDTSGKSLKDYRVEVRNDKLLVYDDEGNLFAYHPNNKEKQRVQQALFHEKQTIIEGCLFGVDINPNSVTICRLRLWIELLKNAYYREDGNLETLPNIDINIKCGNSLISRFALDVDVKQVLQKQKFSIEEYRNAVQTYRNAENKEQKREMETLIAKIKAGFSANLLIGDPKKVKLRQLQGELYNLENQGLLFEETKTEQKAREKKVTKLNNEIDKLTAEIADIESGRLYDNALEWRFEFPEVLNDDGDFVGFDVVIGNPPYIRQEEIKELKLTLQKSYQCYTGVADLFVYFYELGLNLLKSKGNLTYISSNKYFRAGYGEKLRQLLGDSTTIYNLIDFGDFPVFEEAIAYPSIITLSKNKSENNQLQALSWDETKKQDIARFTTVLEQDGLIIAQENLKPDGWRLESSQILDLLAKLRHAGKPLGEYVEGRFYYGIKTGFNEAFVIDRATRDRLINEHPSSAEVIKPFLRGRDVKRWCVDFAEQYLIKIESSENKEHPWSKLSEQEAEKIFNETYPAIYNHFSQFRKSLIKRCDQGRFFWELRSCIYWQEFEQTKIIYPDIAVSCEFAFDNSNFLLDCTLFLIPLNSKHLLGFLNSKIAKFFINQICPAIRGDFKRFKSIYVSQIPIIDATESQRTAIEKLVQKCLDAKKDDTNANTSELEKQIDHLVYKLYQLTYNEVKIIDPEFALTEQEYLDLP
ncbi:MAG: class I SAM-dependent DNA methyltransferase [Microcystis sp. M20BS1]|uniref:class I SAM-dependent DNA methyltransferase n=1 Tax=unclassified Microcystis TaxID=2643300 RepID=UPI00257A2835|nr:MULTISPECIES: TaqI-like C-terminal specificity domain-containing protein [unclassified Microcystis]MCA2623774.1 class I SAM-dependent DNA methyltransferase [Microcystis sp. M19BS1]MCA2634384.1 class I SAM-dependent DNA methyltransferase [Microcystis sp. M20BS1]